MLVYASTHHKEKQNTSFHSLALCICGQHTVLNAPVTFFLSTPIHTHTHTHTHMLTDKHKIYVHHKAKLQAGGTVSFSTTEHFQWKWEVLEQKKEPPKVTAQM